MKLTKRQRLKLRIKQNLSIKKSTGILNCGDMVRVVGNTKLLHILKIGTVGYICQIDIDDYCLVNVPEKSVVQWVAPCDLELWEE